MLKQNVSHLPNNTGWELKSGIATGYVGLKVKKKKTPILTLLKLWTSIDSL